MKKQSFSSLLAAMLLFVAGNLFSQSAALSVQGVLTKSDGTAVDDAQYSVVFQLWTDASAGTKVHEETKNIQTIGGVYSALLGENGFQPTATFNQVYYLGVVVGGTSLTPRPRLTHAPYTLAVIGQNNQFTSTGAVKADGYQANSGAPDVGIANRGYSFRGTGDFDGGLFSYADDQVSLYTNATERIKVTSGLTELKSTNTNTNALFTYGHAHSSSGFWWHNNGSGQFTGMGLGNGVLNLRANDQERLVLWNDGSNYYRTPNGSHIFDQGNVSMSGDLKVFGNYVAGNGVSNAGTGFFKARVSNASNSGGFTFYTPGGTDDFDSGVFSPHDGEVHIRSNGNTRINIGSNGANYISGHTEISLGTGNLHLHDMKPKGTTGNPRNIAIDLSNGRIFEESSSRRYKKNIRTLTEDFRLILKSRPVIYNRFEDPADIDTSKFYELGYIAEEMDSIGLKKLVQYDEDGQIGSFNYDKMILYAVEVLKMQDADIVQMKAELAAIQAEKNKLAAENEALKKQQTQFGAQLEALAKRMNTLENSGATGMRK